MIDMTDIGKALIALNDAIKEASGQIYRLEGEMQEARNALLLAEAEKRDQIRNLEAHIRESQVNINKLVSDRVGGSLVYGRR